ncbi:MarR family transcriptional regulator [Kitasatospora sp. NPDC057015]|uniref:MarR family transcriptional regulator n=1 Tax=Kitasatospora sp. NPDC057015 TaxID=3346001 RepID=UPI00363E28F7
MATLYRRGAMSRADLSRVSGLTAPTVSALVADLEADGLVADVEPRHEGGRRRGKPSMPRSPVRRPPSLCGGRCRNSADHRNRQRPPLSGGRAGC